MSESCAGRQVLRWRGGELREVPDELAAEEPLEIRVRGRAISVTMRTPGHDDELALGFLLSEAVIARSSDVWRVTPCVRNDEGNVIQVQLAPEVHVDLERLTRHVFASSSCGLCGKRTIESVCRRVPPLPPDEFELPAESVVRMPETMHAAQGAFERTGGLHAAALFDEQGEMVVLREDVGRHNAVDKVIGHALRADRLPLARHVLLVSGRVSFEIVQKALAAGVPMIAAVSAPSSLAAEFAEQAGLTLIGFLRPGRMNVYTHVRRVRFAASPT